MSSSNFPINKETIMVADASVIINLNATGHAFEIIKALHALFVVTEKAFAELGAGVHNGHNDANELQKLVASGVVKIAELGEIGSPVYSSLVEGTASRTLDDGEAATIAYAQENDALAIIDDKKALSICESDFPNINVMSTVDLLTHELIKNALGKEKHVYAILNALHHARMRVPLHQVEMIIDLIGYEAAVNCMSLPMSARQKRIIRRNNV